MNSKNIDRQRDWIKKVLSKPEQHFEIVVKFAQEAKKRLGIKDE